MYGQLTPYVLFDWYRGPWTGLVLPNLGVLLPALAAFELALGIAILGRGRAARVGLLTGAAFTLALAPLGFWWPSNVALALGHLALRRVDYREPSLERLAGSRWPPVTPRRRTASRQRRVPSPSPR